MITSSMLPRRALASATSITMALTLAAAAPVQAQTQAETQTQADARTQTTTQPQTERQTEPEREKDKISAWELRVSSGVLLATGALREQVKNAQLSAVQLTWTASPRVALTGGLSWARSRHLSTAGAPRLDVFTADIGAELRTGDWSAERPFSLGGFAGLGAGTRSYNSRQHGVRAVHNPAAFLSVGGEIGIRRVAVRLEARNYVTGFRELVGSGSSELRSDVVIAGTLRLNRKRASAH